MALMPVERLSHSTGIFVYFGLARRDSTMYVLLSSFRGVDSTAWEHLSAFQGVAKTLCTEYIGHLLIEPCGLRDVYTLLPTPERR